MQRMNNDRKIALVKELGETLQKRLREDVKLSPYIMMNKGFLEELGKQIRRLKYDKSKLEI
jgi:hypothetical protein